MIGLVWGVIMWPNKECYPKLRDETIGSAILIYFCFSYKKIRELKPLVSLSVKENDKRIYNKKNIKKIKINLFG